MVSETRRALVLGCGGTLGCAWSIASLLELSRALDWDPRTAKVIVGTSAGAELATLLGSGVEVDALVAASLGAGDAVLSRHFSTPPPAFPRLPSARLGSLSTQLLRSPLAAVAGLLPVGRGDASFLARLVDARVDGDWVEHPATWIVAVDFDSGRRVAFGRTGAPRAAMRDAVRASWAIPGWFPPVSIDGRRYVDGGIVSPASADLVVDEPLDEVIVIAPMSSDPGPRRGLGRIEGVVRALMRRTLDREVEALRARGLRVIRVEPSDEDLEVMGPNFMDPTRRLRVLESSLRTARRNVRWTLEAAS